MVEVNLAFLPLVQDIRLLGCSSVSLCHRPVIDRELGIQNVVCTLHDAPIRDPTRSPRHAMLGYIMHQTSMPKMSRRPQELRTPLKELCETTPQEKARETLAIIWTAIGCHLDYLILDGQFAGFKILVKWPNGSIHP